MKRRGFLGLLGAMIPGVAIAKINREIITTEPQVCTAEPLKTAIGPNYPPSEGWPWRELPRVYPGHSGSEFSGYMRIIRPDGSFHPWLPTDLYHVHLIDYKIVMVDSGPNQVPNVWHSRDMLTRAQDAWDAWSRIPEPKERHLRPTLRVCHKAHHRRLGLFTFSYSFRDHRNEAIGLMYGKGSEVTLDIERRTMSKFKWNTIRIGRA